MTIDAGLKPEGVPERSPIAGAGALSGIGAGPKRYSVQRKMAVVARLLRGEPTHSLPGRRHPTRAPGGTHAFTRSHPKTAFLCPATL
jgi:hypothetical protein